MKIKIAASILAANPLYLGRELQKVEEADLIHVDIMDGHFVPNLAVGRYVVEGLRDVVRVPLSLHLMVEYPLNFIKPFREAARQGDYFIFHVESEDNPTEVISQACELGFKVGISLNPPTPASSVERFLGDVDTLLVMTVNPGFARQRFLPEVMPKLRHLRQVAPEGLDIEVDGGINENNVSLVAREGANVIAAASAIFDAPEPREAIRNLRHLAQSALGGPVKRD